MRVLLARRALTFRGRYCFPCGYVEFDEEIREALVRETREETGLEVRILSYFDKIEYSFVRSGERIEKTVHYYLMEATGGRFDDWDHEFEEVRWVPLDEAVALLDFATESSLVDRVHEALTA